jgi:hypothetical protein
MKRNCAPLKRFCFALPVLLTLSTLIGRAIAEPLPALNGRSSSPAPEITVERCDSPAHVLPAGDIQTDLQISGNTACKVDGSVPDGAYQYRNVNVWGGGSLTFQDAKIDFHAHSILIEAGGTLSAGADAPVAGPVSIWLYGEENDGIPAITCQSGPTCGVPQTIWDSNPNVAHGSMPMGNCKPASDYEPSPVGKDCFYQYEIFEGAQQGAFFGRKVLALSYGGSLYLRGRKGIRAGRMNDTPSDSGTSWVRLTDTLKTGQNSFHVDRAVPTWDPGDHIVVTSTDYLPGHSEELIIASMGSDSMGTKITLQSPVRFPHYGVAYDFSSISSSSGPRNDLNGPKTQPSRHLETRAAVALLTRSIMIASEGATPMLSNRGVEHFSAKGFYGGHTLIREGFSNFQVQGVEYYELGQGGVIGRYPVHFHMARAVPQPVLSPPYDGTYIADSSIHDSMTRFITVHATQGVLVARNVGYRSIGHGFYLEDATETNNRLYSNIGIQSRAAVDDDLNPRLVPGILARPGDSGAELFPFHSDYDHPSIYWISNTWNDFQYNVAVGAGTCGACYWMPPFRISGSSVYETWESYASMQTKGREGVVPLMNFVGNSCSTAMNAIETVGDTTPCLGVDAADAPANPNRLRAIANPNPLPPDRYPAIDTGLRQHATVCDAQHQADCSTVPICTGEGPNEAGCAATVIDHFTSSFTWAQKNFAALWLRGWWYLVTDSAITDVQSGGLTMVSGGGYTRADAAQGFWNLSNRNLFVGNTQPNDLATGVPDNAAASNAGPFNPFALSCAYNPQFCISRADDISFQNDAFSGSQRLLSIYDGPSFEDSDAFMDVHVTKVGTLGQCKPGGNQFPGSCADLKWMNAYDPGVLQNPATNNPMNDCVLPNAAIAWKQPNGFYYPPAFHSTNLVYKDVDIRHFVIQPLWKPKSFNQDQAAVQKAYCSWESTIFSNFTDVDRQTELSDDDGSLTGLVSGEAPIHEPSISITKDPFYNAPLSTPECASSAPGLDATVDTSPYQYVTTAIYATCSNLRNLGTCLQDWGQDCGSQGCYGIPLYRQFLTDTEFNTFKSNPADRPSIRMMGQGTGQRSTMTINHGSYYVDTTLSRADQGSVRSFNVFLPNQKYLMYFLYATAKMHQTYSLYLGKATKQEAFSAVVPGRVSIKDASYGFSEDQTGDWITDKQYDPDTGLLTLTVDLANQALVFKNDAPNFCQPQTYCSLNEETGACGCKPFSNCKENSVCAWSTKDIDCPIAGCFAMEITMPASFKAEKQPNLPPAPVHFTGDPASDPYFKPGNVVFTNVPESISGKQCRYDTPPTASLAP